MDPKINWPAEKWAVLIGINWYSEGEDENLRGCLNDVEKTKAMLSTYLKVQSIISKI